MKKLWIALGMLTFALLLAGIYVLAAQMGVDFTDASGR